MWCKRVEESCESGFPFLSTLCISWGSLIHHDIEHRDGRIKFHIFYIFSYFFDSLVHSLDSPHVIACQKCSQFITRFISSKETMNFLKQSIVSDDRLGVPRRNITEIRHTHLIHA
jgi:hypothetical protein